MSAALMLFLVRTYTHQILLKGQTIGTDVFDIIHASMETVINEYHDYMDQFKSFHVDRRLTLLYPHIYRMMKYERDNGFILILTMILMCMVVVPLI